MHPELIGLRRKELRALCDKQKLPYTAEGTKWDLVQMLTDNPAPPEAPKKSKGKK